MTPKRKSHNENPFTYELANGEQLLWTGRPNPWKIFTREDFFIIPFTLVWGGFVVALNAAIWTVNGPLVGKIAGFPFLVAGLYMMVGRFFYKVWRKRRLYYAVTDQRVMILLKGIRYDLRSFSIGMIPYLHKYVEMNGYGKVVFGGPAPLNRWQQQQLDNPNSSFEWAGFALDGFYDIPDAHEVYALMKELCYGQRQGRSAESAPDTPVEFMPGPAASPSGRRVRSG
jgi:hypothetical protein